MMPQTKSTSAPPSTSKRFRRAKSMSSRIIVVSCLLLGDFGGELESVGDDFIAGLHAVANLLHAVGQRGHRPAPQSCGNCFPPSLRKTQSLSCRRMMAVEGTTTRSVSLRERKVATANMPGRSEPSEIAEHDAHLGGARVGIEHAGNVGDLAFEDAIGKGIQADLGRVAKMHFAEIVLEDIADHPDLRRDWRW